MHNHLTRSLFPAHALYAACLTLVFQPVIQPAFAAEDSAKKLAEARAHLQKGRVEEAVEAYGELAKTDADPVAVAIGLSRCREAQGDPKSAREILQAAVKQHPTEAALWTRLAEVLFQQGKFDETESAVAEALKLSPDFPAAKLLRGQLWTETGKLKEADQEFRSFIRMYNKLQPKDADTLLVIAQGAAQYARWHGSSQNFSFVVNTLCPDALADDPERWQAYQLSGSLLLEKYNRAQALPEFRHALEINPRAAEVFVSTGNAHLEDLELQEAEEDADRALEINPKLVGALLLKADLKLNEGNIAAARELLDQAEPLNPCDQRTLARLAACDICDDGPPAPAELETVLNHLESIDKLTLEKPSRLAQRIIDIARWNPHPGSFLHQLGEVLENRRKFDLAERFFKASIRSMPQLADPKTALGMLYMRIGRPEEAAKILDAALEADPFHVRVSNMRKVVKILNGYETITTDHFVIRVDSETDKMLGKYMAEYLEEQYPGLVKQFGFEPQQRTQFEVYSKAKGLSAHEWFSARMVGLPWVQTIGASTGLIVALASPTSGEQQFNWARVVKHEFVHILTLQQTNFNIPHWFTEALAVLNEGSPRSETWNQLLMERVPKGELMNLDTLDMGFKHPKTPLDWQMAYCQSKLYAEYMIARFGSGKIGEMLNAYRDNLKTDEVIPKVFGVTKDDFEEGYLTYIRKLTDQLQDVSAEPEVSLADAEKAHLEDEEEPHAGARYAYELWKAHQYKEARKLATKILAKHEHEPLAGLVMAHLELRGEDVPSAIEFLTDALDHDQPHPLVLELLAKLKMQEGSFSEAADLYELGLKRNPSNAAWSKGIAVAYLKLHEGPKLRDRLKRLSEMDPDDVAVRKKLAALSMEDQAYEDAVKYAKLALQIDVLDPDVHHLLSDAYTQLKQFPQAIDEGKAALELRSDDLDFKVALARTYIAADKKTEATELLNQVLETNPGYTVAKQLLRGLK